MDRTTGRAPKGMKSGGNSRAAAISRRASRLARKFLAFGLSGLIAFQPILAQAQQLAPDSGAPAVNRPGVGAAPNGVPLVDIVTPNSQGLSHNKYNDFNVGTPGLILNNYNGETGTSKLGGITPGNANLRNSGPASIILNEVTSGNRSALNGATEVFGGRADVIVANPNGITCDGCGFINTPRATLTTGVPDIGGDGRLNGFTVHGGDVTFGARGGNFASGDGAVDLFDIVSRTVRVDGPVNGKNLRLTAGRNSFDYATGNATALGGADDAGEFAIDGSALGAMQAGSIKMVVTDKGAGVRMRGDMAANAGELTLSADGKISLGNASGRDGVTIRSKRQVEAKKVTSKKGVTVDAGTGITLEAVAADEDVLLANGTGLLSITSELATLGNLNLTSAGAIAAGNVSAGKDAVLQAEQGIAAGQVIANGAARLSSASGNIAISGTAKAGGGDLTVTAVSGAISAASLISVNNMTLTAGKDIAVLGDMLSGNALIASARSIKAKTAVSGLDFSATNVANGTITLTSSGDMRLEAMADAIDIASLLSAGNLNATGASITAQNVTGHGVVTLAGNTDVSGQILGARNVGITGDNIRAGVIISGVDFAAGKASPTGAIVLGKEGDLTLQAGSGAIDVGTLLSAGGLVANAGTFSAADVTSYGATSIAGTTAISGQLLAGSDITIAGPAITIGTAVAGVDLAGLNDGRVVLANAEHTLNLTATAGNLTANRLLSSGDMTAAATGNLSANAISHGDLRLTAGGSLTLSGQSLAGGNAELTANSMSLGTLASGVDFAATEQSGGSLILRAGNAQPGQMTLTANGGSIVADQLVSGGDLAARALRDITYNNSLQSFAGASLRADQGSISLDRNTVARGNITLTLQSLDLSNDRGKLATAGLLTVNAGNANLTNSTLTFGGIALNLSGSADVSGSKLRAVAADGGSGDIAIAAQTITTTSATALLAADDLTLTLASLTNAGQLAANNDLIFNVSGNFTNTPTGLVYAGRDGRVYVAGDLLNDQGAILVDRDLTIAANAAGGRNHSITNVSGLIRAGRDVSISTANLINKRLYVPGLATIKRDPTTLVTFMLNRELWDKPFAQLYQGWNNDTADSKILFPELGRQDWEDYKDRLWGEAVLADGTSFRAWNWISAVGPTGSHDIRDWIASRLPQDENGNPVIDPNNPSKHFIVNYQGKPRDTSTTYTWDDAAGISQTIYEDAFDGNAAAEALIRSGRDLVIDATVLNNSYSSIEADGDAVLQGQTLANEGIVATRKTMLECHAQGVCEAYDANGNPDPSKNIANGSSILVRTEVVGQLAGNIKAAGNLDISGFATVNNTSAPGSIAGGAQLSTAPTPNDPTAGLNGLTAGGALFTPNAALGGVSANGTPLAGADLVAALGQTAPKPNSGGFGGTIPGQVFLYETRAEFLDVGKFYGSGYFINRIGYNPDRTIPFLGDAYFENQLIDQQLRQLANQGLGKGSFIPGSDAIEQMKTLLDRGADFAAAHGLAIGERLSPELIANLTETMVWYEKQTINGIEVLVPTVYIANTDKANLTVAGALISGGSLAMNVGEVANSGAITAKTDLGLAATSITATGGSFKAGNDLSLSATQNITLTAQSTNIDGQNVVNPNAMVSAGGNAALQAGETLKLQGAGIEAGGNAVLSGRDVTLDAQKVENAGSQNATGTRIDAGGDLGIKAENDVTVIGSSAKADGALDVTTEQGSVNVVTTDVTRKSNDGYTRRNSTTQQQSQFSSGGDTTIRAGQDVLISGSSVASGGDASIAAGGNVNITAAQNNEAIAFGRNSGETTTHTGSQISAKGDIAVSAGESGTGNLNIVGSKIAADQSVGLKAADNITIAEARDSSSLELHNKSGKKARTDSQFTIETTVGSSVSGKTGVDIASGNDTTISASNVQAGDDDNKADLNIDTGGDLIVSSGRDTLEQETKSRKKGFLSRKKWSTEVHDETTVASELSASGNVNLNADKNVAIAGSSVTAGENIAIEGDSVSVIGAQEAHDLKDTSKTSGLGAGSGGGFFSIWGKQEKSGKTGVIANVGSELSAAGDVTITARASDVNIIGSGIDAGRDITLSATRDVNITPGAESFSSEEEEKRSGFGLSFSGGNGGFSVGIGAQKSTDKTAEQSDTNATSVLKAGRDLNISAGNNVNLQAVQASAERDVNLFAGNDINLLSAQDQTNYQEMHEKTFAGVTVSVTSQLGKAADSIMNSAGRLSDSGGVNALTNTAIAGLGFYQAYKDLKGVYEGLTSTDPKIGTGLSFNIGINAGISHQESKSSSMTSTPVVTDIRAGRSITMEAENGSITSDGAQIAAGYDKYGLPTLSGDPLAGDIFLSAKNGDINLNAATATSDSTSSNSSWNAGVGVNLGCTTRTKCDASVGVNGSYGKGGSGSVVTSHTNTHVNGSGDVTLVTNDLTLKGATVAGNSVTADVRNLTVESLVDTAKARADQLNFSAQIGFGSASISGVIQKAKGDAAVVSEQSGIHAGIGGLDLDVEKQTTLKGGLITSEAASDRNTLETGTLTVTDVDTRSSWKAETYGGSIGTGGLSIAPPVKDGDSASGKAYSAIGANIGITITDPAHQTQDIGTIRRDTENTNTSLPGLPDLQEILRDQYRTQADLQEAQKTMAGLVGDIASELYKQAAANKDQAGMDYWKEGGIGRAALHAIGGGILGGVNGWEGAVKAALGGASSTLLSPAIAALVDGMLKGTKYEGTQEGAALAKLIGASLAVGIGAVVGGGEGAAYGAANYQNNYLKHKELQELYEKFAACEKATNPVACRQSAWNTAVLQSRANLAALKLCGNDLSCVGKHLQEIKDGDQMRVLIGNTDWTLDPNASPMAIANTLYGWQSDVEGETWQYLAQVTAGTPLFGEFEGLIARSISATLGACDFLCMDDIRTAEGLAGVRPKVKGDFDPSDPTLSVKGDQLFETAPVAADGKTIGERADSYENGVRANYDNATPEERRYQTLVDGKMVSGVADDVTNIDGKLTAVEAKYVDDWTKSIRNPFGTIGSWSWSKTEQANVLAQAKKYSQAFEGGVIYHTNSVEFANYYSKVFAANGVKNVRFVITPIK